MSVSGLLSSLPACSVRSDAVPSTSGRVSHAFTAPLFSSNHAYNHAAFGVRGRRGHCQTSRGRLHISCAIKKRTDKHIICNKTLKIKPDRTDKVVKMCRKIVDFSQQKMQDSKCGVLAFECSQDNWEPNVVHFWERYEGNRSMGLHNTTDEYSTFMNSVQQHLEGPVGMVLYEWKDGKIGNPCIHGGPKGEGGLDDATGAGGSGGASYKQNIPAQNRGDAEQEGNVEPEGNVEQGGKEAWSMFKWPWQKKEKAKK